MHTAYDDGYLKERIDGRNPYSRCVHCKKTTPEINGQLENHAEWCEYRTRREREAKYQDLLVLSRMMGEALRECLDGNPELDHPEASRELLELLDEFTE